MEVKPDTGINIGTNPFYRPSNSGYGSDWQSSGGLNPLKTDDVPLYPDVVGKFYILIFIIIFLKMQIHVKYFENIYL